MSKKDVLGPLNQLYAISVGPTAVGESEAILNLHDPELVEAVLRGMLSDELNADALRRLLMDDPRAAEMLLSDSRLLQTFAARIARGEAVAKHGILARHFDEDLAHEAGPLDEGDEEGEDEVKIRDWRIECHHHAAGSRPFFERGSKIQVVPTISGDLPYKDEVKILWRDDYLGSMPPSLTVRTAGRPDIEARQTGSDGPFTVYSFDAAYLDDVEGLVVPPFWKGTFWSTIFNPKTTYSVAPGPTGVGVEVFNPHKWKFELKLPPWATFKDGHKWAPEAGGGVKALANKAKLKHTVETEDTTYSPSTLTINATKTSSDPGPDFKPTDSEMKLDSVKLSRDGKALNLDALAFIGKLLKFQESWRDLLQAIKKFKDYAPEMGWYVDVSLQLAQGGLAAEWYWKEHTDHRVFKYWDVNIELTLFNLTFEVGLGVGAFSFKLQIFASISGEMGIKGGLKRDDPDAGIGVTLPTITGKITGALGARVEGGAFFKFEAKGETAVEAELTVGFNQRNSPMIFDMRARWTGIECTATGSVGIWGIGGTRTWKTTLVEPSRWIGLELPADQPYTPPHMSRSAIKSAVQAALTTGWDIRVIRSVSGWGNDVHWTPDQIAEAIAAKIDADQRVDRTPKTMEGLTHALRGDLERLGSHWGRDYVEESDFLRYVNSSVNGKSLQKHIVAAHSPERCLIAANK